MLHTRCTSALSYISAMCLVAINMLLRWFYTSIMLSIDMQFMLNEGKQLS